MLGKQHPSRVFLEGSLPVFLSLQPPALLAQVFLEWALPTDQCAVEMHSMIFPKLSMSFFIFLAITISCSKKFHYLITVFFKCHFLLFAQNLLPGQASLEVADVSGGEGILKVLLVLSLCLRW